MVTQLAFDPDPKSFNTTLREASDTKYKLRLIASVSSSITVPAGASLVVFSSDVVCWIGVNEVPVLPTSGTASTSTGELNPVGFEVAAGDVINIITRTDGDFSAAFYA